MNRRKDEAFQRLKQLAVGLFICVMAVGIANAWMGIATSAGYIQKLPQSEWNGPRDNGNLTNSQANNGIDDSTEQSNAFFVMITNWVVGTLGGALGLLIVLIGFKHSTETDPTKKD